MKIKKELPQFLGQKALIVATGEHEANLYTARTGIIEKVGHVRVTEPIYSDREGMFRSRTKRGKRAMTLRTGSPVEGKKQKMRTEFLKKLAAEIKKVDGKKDTSIIYLFSPLPIRNELYSALLKRHQELIMGEFEGNHTRRGPFGLLELIQKDQRRVGALIKEKMETRERPEVKKLLRKGIK